MTTLMPEQIEAVRIMDGQMFQPGILNALCDLALQAHTARRDALEAALTAVNLCILSKQGIEQARDAIRALAAQPSSPPQTRETLCASQVETPSASRSAAGGDSPTPLVDAWEFDVPYLGGDTMKVVRSEFARDLESAARMIAEALEDTLHNNPALTKALAAWRELKERK